MRSSMSMGKRVLRCVYAWYGRTRLSFIKGLEFGDGVFCKGMPIVDIAPGAKIVIGNGVTINSVNAGYHINMHSPVKLMADRNGATIRIGDYSRIHGSCIHACHSVEIGKHCLIAANCQIIDSNGHEHSAEDVEDRINTQDQGRPVTIEDSVWIGANSFVLPGVRIGRGSIIAACSVVVHDVPPMVLAAGNPAKVVKRLSVGEPL